MSHEPLIVNVSRTIRPLGLGLAQKNAVQENTLMTPRVEQIAEQVKALPENEREQLLSWLADFELEHSDAWDEEIARDSQPGGRLSSVLDRVLRDIAEGRTKPLDEVIDDA